MARIKIGIPVVGDIREGEIEHRYIDGIGLILYTKYRNQLYSSKMHSSSVPPLVDKKSSNVIKSSAFITQDITTGELDLDFSSLSSGDLANGDFILFMDTSSSYDVKKESLADLSTLLAGTASSTGLSASSSVLSVSDLHPVGVDGANNQLITDNGNGTVTSESGLTYNGSTLGVQGDITVSGGDITYGNGQNATVSVTPTAHNTAGKLLTISAGNTTAGTTNNIAGGSLKFEAGQGKGSGAGGNIVFATANAGVSGSSLNALATALTISDDLSSTFTGAIIGTTIDASTDFTVGSTVITDDSIVMTPSTSDTITIAGSTHGALSITTVDNAAAAANIQITADGTAELAGTTVTLDSSGDIVFSADGDQVTMDDGTTTRFTFNVDSTPEIDVTGAFTIDGSSTIRLDAVSNIDLYTNSREVLKFDTNSHAYLHSYNLTLYNDYSINSKTGPYHYTSGVADYQENYSILTEHLVSGGSDYNTNYGSAL